jgi:hypothetical protein
MSVPGIRVVAAGAGEPPAADAAPGSVLAHVRAAAAAQRRTKTLRLAVGGEFGERLIVVYGVLPVDELERYVTLAAAGAMRELGLAIDMAIASCQTLIWHEHDVDTDLHVRLDTALWQLLDWPLPEGIDDVDELTPADVVRHLFGGNGIALAEHLEQLSTWMRNPGGDAPGEASPAN